MGNLLKSGRDIAYDYFINGQRFEGISEAAATICVHKSTISRWCKSDNKPDCYREAKGTTKKELADGVATEAKDSGQTPLDVMLEIMRDKTQDVKIRAQMAQWAAPYIHPKIDTTKGKKGKKDELADKAKDAGDGCFAPSSPPNLKVAK